MVIDQGGQAPAGEEVPVVLEVRLQKRQEQEKGLSTPLVLSVHSIVSFDFATAGLPGWHATIFPPYFVIGAIYSGVAVVILAAVSFGNALQLFREYFQKYPDEAMAPAALIESWSMAVSMAAAGIVMKRSQTKFIDQWRRTGALNEFR